ncbi:TetR/AcrR family transcriptional regulator [Devosia sp. LC5]|uniref:TetR/AcrR family transcriptional regulator n=1 Tax=Devosia sp. LC5 TaxID=1502724 RepID=UPI00055752FC|nr:TetR/AcrR family transcriptional regulator [Devosia sp. LC5]
MPVLRQRAKTASTEKGEATERGPRARTRRLMLQSATALMQSGATPSVSEVAEAAGVSRATAYRYFPSQAVLVHAVVDEALGPILDWKTDESDTRARVKDLLASSMPRINEFEATFKAALKLSLDQWARRQVGTLGAEPQFTRGHRVDLLMRATRPMADTLSRAQRLRLSQALSLIFGVELIIVLRDIWGLAAAEAEAVAQWAALALVNAAEAEAAGEKKPR